MAIPRTAVSILKVIDQSTHGRPAPQLHDFQSSTDYEQCKPNTQGFR
jgi:hypothetical protein